MNRRALLVIAVLVSGCSLVLAPDRDYNRDAGSDGGLDAGADAGFDGGDLDGGEGDGGCPGSQGIENVCDDGMDNDCNGIIDCADYACAASPACCDDGPMAGTPWTGIGRYDSVWTRDGEMGLPVVTGSTVDFGTATYPQALVLNNCAPLAFGMDFNLSFAITPGMRGDYAAIKLGPVNMRGGTEPYLSELTVRVLDSGEVRLERAGALVRSIMAGTDVIVEIQLRPGLDEASRGVVLATVDAGANLATDLPFMPLSDLRGSPTCAPDGLFVVLEGQGPNVTVSSATTATQYNCENPNQFLPDRSTPPFGDLVEQFESNASGWRTGGLGEPAVLHTNVMPANRLELWGDAARVERSDELLRFIDFTIGATRFEPDSSPSAVPRLLDSVGPDVPEIFGPSAREPSIGAPMSTAGVLNGTDLLIAYADKRPMADLYDIDMAVVDLSQPVSPRSPQNLLEPIDVNCESLRDPSIVVLGSDRLADGLLVFYTCEQAGVPDRIGVARFEYSSPSYVLQSFNSDLITSEVGAYAARGVFSPEAVLLPARMMGRTQPGIRLWFLTRDNSGQVAMSTAVGEIPIEQTLPIISPYPGNPILVGNDPILGGNCAIGCTLDAMGVARTLPTGRWPEPSYLMVVAQSRQTVTGVDHALVPLIQPRAAAD